MGYAKFWKYDVTDKCIDWVNFIYSNLLNSVFIIHGPKFPNFDVDVRCAIRKLAIFMW